MGRAEETAFAVVDEIIEARLEADCAEEFGETARRLIAITVVKERSDARAQALEEAAKVAEGKFAHGKDMPPGALVATSVAVRIAQTIRELKTDG